MWRCVCIEALLGLSLKPRGLCLGATPTALTLVALLAGAAVHTSFKLQSKAEFEAATGTRAPSGKRYFNHSKLADIIRAYPLPDVSQLQNASLESRTLKVFSGSGFKRRGTEGPVIKHLLH